MKSPKVEDHTHTSTEHIHTDIKLDNVVRGSKEKTMLRSLTYIYQVHELNTE
jgi:hypothetical protein